MNIPLLLKKHPTITCQYELAEICKPLNQLGIVYFSHAHIDAQSNMYTIGLCPDFFRTYCELGFYQYDLHMRPTDVSESYMVWDSIERRGMSFKLHKTFTEFNQDHTFSIIKQNHHGKDIYHFAALPNNDLMNAQYLVLLDKLKLFINYFTEQVQKQPALKAAYTIPIKINFEQGGYLVQNTEQAIENLQLKCNRFYIDHAEYLTKRELKILMMLMQSKNQHEVAEMLYITPRTVKEHLKNIKEKW